MHVDVVSFYLFSCFGSFHGFLFWLKKRNKETNISDMEIKISPFCLKKKWPLYPAFSFGPLFEFGSNLSHHHLMFSHLFVLPGFCRVSWVIFFWTPPKKKSQPTKVGQKKCVLFFFQFLPGDSTIKGTQQNKKLPFFELLKQRFHDWVGETFPHCLCLGPKLGKFCKSWRVVYIMEEYFTVYS